MTKHLLPPDFTSCKPAVASGGPNMLIICDKSRWIAQGRDLPNTASCCYIEFGALTLDVLAELKPDVLLSPLVGENFDALDVARKLVKFGYHGPYRAVTNAIPNPHAVCTEVRAAALDINFDLIVLPNIAQIAEEALVLD